MAKICPCTGKTVLYPDCLECDDRDICRSGKISPVQEKKDNGDTIGIKQMYRSNNGEK